MNLSFHIYKITRFVFYRTLSPISATVSKFDANDPRSFYIYDMKHLISLKESFQIGNDGTELYRKMISQDFVADCPRELKEKYGKLVRELETLIGKDFLDRLEKSNRIIDEMRKIRFLADPPIYITQATERNGDKILQAKLSWGSGPNKKIETVYVGKSETFQGKDDPEAIRIGKEKMSRKLLKK